MKFIKTAVSLLITGILIYFFNFGFGAVPALGKFLNPFSGFWTNSELPNDTKGQLESTLQIPGCLDEVIIKYDDNAVPHIFANNDHDLYLAQGYVTAQDRLWQMEFQTHFAGGRISEIVGEKGLESDRYQRRMGSVYGAENSLAGMMEDPESKVALDAYTEGVNAYIKNLSSQNLPFEYKLLGYEPELWTPLKSALFLKNMSFVLASGSDELKMTNIANKYGKEITEALFPNYPNHESPIIPTGTKTDFKPLALPKYNESFIGKGSKEVPEEQDKSIGSNNWAISGAKSATGLPILANDPHLTLSLPSIWYQIQMTAPGINVYGSTMPGSPNVIIGFNENIAWGVTNVGADIMDWYEVKFKDAKMNEYFHDNQWKKVTKRIETIKVKGKPNVVDTVLYTHHGPVVYLEKEKPFKNYIPTGHALRWIAHEKSHELTAFYKLNRAKNYDEYVNALGYYGAPAQNFVFASNQNDIAIWVNGKFPLKARQQGKYILDGSEKAADWQGYVPALQNPHVKNPAHGYVSSANQSSVDPKYPYYINWAFGASERGRRINERLQSMNKGTVDSLRLLQDDNFNIRAREYLPILLSKITKPNDKILKAINTLKAWNLKNDPDEIAPSIFEEWIANLGHAIWKDEFGGSESFPMKYPSFDKTAELITKKPTAKWFDNVTTKNIVETLEDNLTGSLSATIDSLTARHGAEMSTKWTWANTKSTDVKHLLGGSNSTFDKFSAMNLQAGGGNGIVNAITNRTGPSWRMVVQLGNKSKGTLKGYGLYPGGQSGNPGSKYYDNMIDKWVKGELNELLFLQNKEEKSDLIQKIVKISKK